MSRMMKLIAVVVVCTIIPGVADELIIAAIALVMWLSKPKKA